MLEHLFGSKARVKILHLLLNNPSQPYYLRQLARKLRMQLNSIRRELTNLETLGIVKSVQLIEEQTPKKGSRQAQGGAKKYYLLNTDLGLYPELKALFLKSQLLMEKTFIRKIEQLAKVKIFILTGSFVGLEGFSTDLFIVGSVNRQKLARLVRGFERELDREINYTVMSEAEYKYRKDITDRFLYDILENKKIVIVDRIKGPVNEGVLL